jgi:NurA-like 5'-3' nuclease
MEITHAIEELKNVNAYLYSLEALMEWILDIKVAKNVEVELKKILKS